MLKKQIQVGSLYRAKVSGKVVTVRVDAIREYDPSFGGTYRRCNTQTRYEVTNLSTGRKTTFRSAAKFRGPAAINDEYRRDQPLRQRLNRVASLGEILKSMGVTPEADV